MTTDDGNADPGVVIPFPQRRRPHANGTSMAGQVLTIVDAARATAQSLKTAADAAHLLVDSHQQAMALAREAAELRALFTDLKRDLERLRHCYT